jgi:hypothetical protein
MTGGLVIGRQSVDAALTDKCPPSPCPHASAPDGSWKLPASADNALVPARCQDVQHVLKREPSAATDAADAPGEEVNVTTALLSKGAPPDGSSPELVSKWAQDFRSFEMSTPTHVCGLAAATCTASPASVAPTDPPTDSPPVPMHPIPDSPLAMTWSKGADTAALSKALVASQTEQRAMVQSLAEGGPQAHHIQSSEVLPPNVIDAVCVPSSCGELERKRQPQAGFREQQAHGLPCTVTGGNGGSSLGELLVTTFQGRATGSSDGACRLSSSLLAPGTDCGDRARAQTVSVMGIDLQSMSNASPTQSGHALHLPLDQHAATHAQRCGGARRLKTHMIHMTPSMSSVDA